MSELATIEDVMKVEPRITDEMSLCDFLGKTEREIIVCQTIHACPNNQKNNGACFSFNEIRESGFSENGTSLDWLVEHKLLAKGEHEGKPVLYPTKKLIEDILKYFVKEDKRRKKRRKSLLREDRKKRYERRKTLKKRRRTNSPKRKN